MPSFIEWPGDQQGPPPYVFGDVDVFTFPTLGKRDAIEAFIDQMLNNVLEGSPVEYRAWGGGEKAVAFVAVLEYARMQCVDWLDRGYVSQNELAFLLPVERFRNGVWAGWALYAPYIFVDNPWSVVTGNTVIGYPKASADFLIGTAEEEPYPIDITALAFESYDPNAPARSEQLLGVEQESDAVGDLEDWLWPFLPFTGLFGPNGEMPLEEEVYARILESLDPFDAPALGYDVVQMRQIRDPVDPKQATTQAVYEFPVEATLWRGGGLLKEARVTIKDTASWPVAASLGLSPSFVCRLPYWQRLDFRMGKGTKIG